MVNKDRKICQGCCQLFPRDELEVISHKGKFCKDCIKRWKDGGELNIPKQKHNEKKEVFRTGSNGEVRELLEKLYD